MAAQTVYKLVDDNFCIPQLTLRWLDSITGPVKVVAFSGLGRSGKSDTASRFIRSLSRAPLTPLFETSDEVNAKTIGMDSVVFQDSNGTTWLVIDCEGIANGASYNHAKILALSSQICSVLCYVEQSNLNHRAINSVADMIAQGKNTFGSNAQWPYLCMLINLMTLRTPANLDAFFSSKLDDDPNDVPNNLDRQAVRTTFPRKKLCTLPVASDQDRDNASSAYSQSFNILKNAIQTNATVLNTLGKTLRNYLSDLVDTVRNAAVIDIPSRLQQLVNVAIESVVKAQLTFYDNNHNLPMDGRTDDAEITRRHNVLRGNLVQAFNTSTATYPDALRDPQRTILIIKLDQKLPPILAANAHQREVVRSDVESSYRVAGRFDRHVDTWRRRVWFHEDVKYIFHIFERRVPTTRTRHQRRNGDVFYSPDWIDCGGEYHVHVGNREDCDSHPKIF